MANGHGGARPGAGRKPGKTNTKTTAAIIKAAVAKGLDLPLDLLLRVMRDPAADWQDRKWAAAQAAPYCHPRLAATEIKSENTQRVVVHMPSPCATMEEWSARYAHLANARPKEIAPKAEEPQGIIVDIPDPTKTLN